MDCPKYIREALKKRAKAAFNYLKYDYMVSTWLESKDLDFKVEEYDIRTGVESLMNPYASSKRVLDVIEKA